jgi:ribonuclease BN (tRNA processing enzyme)
MGDRLILLGTAGGAETAVRPTGPTSAAYGISSALIVGGRIYLVDVGQGSSRQLTLLDPLGAGHRRVMHDLAAIFLTHLHSDHTMDLVNFAVCSYLQGWPDGSLPVYGPWPRLIEAADVVMMVSNSMGVNRPRAGLRFGGGGRCARSR